MMKKILPIKVNNIVMERGHFYLVDNRKICTLTFIGHNPIKITVFHDIKAYNEFLEWCIN